MKLNYRWDYVKFLFDSKHKTDIQNFDIFFFFPFYHIGGAERVHIDIIKVFKEYNPICFITEKSKDHFKKEFEELATIIHLRKLAKKKFKHFLLKKIAKQINKKENPIIFGCNSLLFYDLIPHLDKHVKVIDLVHAFSDNESWAAEIYSLPHVPRINKRVVLGAKTKNDFINLYATKNIKSELSENIVIINNKVSIPSTYHKEFNDNLVVLFVGRDSAEKRPKFFIEIAKKMLAVNKELKFKLIGDFSNFKNDNLLENVEFVDEIKDKEILIGHYKSADVIMITSRREGLPMVILEGMAYGMVPMSTNVGEIPSLINQENNNGILIDNNQEDSKIIDDFVNELIALNSDKIKLNELSKNAYDSIKGIYSEEEYTRKYRELFFK